MKFAIGMVISFVVGMGCRYFGIPVGSPSTLPDAFLVLAMTAGYSCTNRIMMAHSSLAATFLPTARRQDLPLVLLRPLHIQTNNSSVCPKAHGETHCEPGVIRPCCRHLTGSRDRREPVSKPRFVQ